jgi:hypothetical protein
LWYVPILVFQQCSSLNDAPQQGIAWGGTAVSLIFFVFRICVRIKSFKRLYADDFLVLLAWLSLFGSAIVWQTQQTAMYHQYDLAAGKVSPTPEILEAEIVFLRTEVATIILFYVCLWCVKISFLIFFRRLGQNVRGLRVWWWVVLGFTIAFFATCIGDTQYSCLLRSLDWILSMQELPILFENLMLTKAAECISKKAMDYQRSTLHYNCAADVISDFMSELACIAHLSC